jgi:hypothetical protein
MPNDFLRDDYIPSLPRRRLTAADVTAAKRREEEAAEKAAADQLAAAEAEVDRLTTENERLEAINRQLRGRLQKMERDADISHAAELKRMRERPQPAPPPPAPPDYTPALIALVEKLSDRKTPTGVKRTPEGMQLVFDDDSSKENPQT